jgi:hypothetical protein
MGHTTSTRRAELYRRRQWYGGAILLRLVASEPVGRTEPTFANCAYRLRGHEPPPALADEAHALSPRVCLGLARGEGWLPLVTTEGAWIPSMHRASQHFWTSVLALAPLNASSGRLFPPPPRAAAAAAPIERIAAFLRHVTQSAIGPAKLCLVGDSLTRSIGVDFALVKMHLDGLPAPARERLLSGLRAPIVRYINTNFGLDREGLRAGHRCHRLCRARATRANAWQRALTTARCTTVVVEPAAAHHAGVAMREPVHGRLATALREAIDARIARGALNLSRHLADVRSFRSLDHATATEVAHVMASHGDRVPAAYKRDALAIAVVLASWARSAPGRTAIIRSPSPQMFPITGEFTKLTRRSATYPLKAWTPFATARCGCPRLHPAIARNTIFAQMARFLRGALGANASFAALRYHDTYAEFAYDPALAYERAFVGCFNGAGTRGAAACAAGLADRDGQRLRGALRGLPPPTGIERRFLADRSDDFCDCTHVGFSPYRLAVVADGWRTAPTGAELAAAGATATAVGLFGVIRGGATVGAATVGAEAGSRQ